MFMGGVFLKKDLIKVISVTVVGTILILMVPYLLRLFL